MNDDTKLELSLNSLIVRGTAGAGDDTLIKRIISLVREHDNDTWVNVADKLPPKSTPDRTITALLWTPTSFISPYIVGCATMDNQVNVPYNIDDWVTPGGSWIINEVKCWKPLLPPSNACINNLK